jgi:hypothetical protein
MARYHREGRQHEISISDLNRALADFPRQNYEDALFDSSVQSGVLQGLNVIPSVVPNLSVVVQTGRAVYRDTVNARGKLVAVNSDQTLDLSGQVPGSGSVTRYITARPRTASPFGGDTLITPAGAGVSSPFYDPTYTPTAYAPSDGDDCTTANTGVEIRTTAPSGDDRILLATITLTAGQTQITTTSINNKARGYATGFLAEHNASGVHLIQDEIFIGDAGAPAFNAGFSQHPSPLGFYKGIDGQVHLFGKFNVTATASGGVTVFTLPVGYRPRIANFENYGTRGDLGVGSSYYDLGVKVNGDFQIFNPTSGNAPFINLSFRGY